MATELPVNELLPILCSARELLADKMFWARGAQAQDEFGEKVHPASPRAVRWSVEGAVAVAACQGGVIPPKVLILLDKITVDLYKDVLPDSGIPGDGTGILTRVSELNDEYGHDAVLHVLDKAIDVAIKEGLT